MEPEENLKRKRGRPKVADPKAAQIRAERVYRQRQREAMLYMKMVTAEAESLNEVLKAAQGQQVTLTLDFDCESTPDGLRHLRERIEAETTRETAKNRRKKKAR